MLKHFTFDVLHQRLNILRYFELTKFFLDLYLAKYFSKTVFFV